MWSVYVRCCLPSQTCYRQIVRARMLSTFPYRLPASEKCFELLLPLMEDADVRTQPGVDSDGCAELQLFHATALHLACAKGQTAMARALLDRGADRMARENMQCTPLHYAAISGALSCVILLVGRPEKPLLTLEEISAPEQIGVTALHHAASIGNEKICGVLLAMGAQLDAKTRRGHTPLEYAQENHPDKASLLELLSGRGPANPPGTVCDHCGKPAGRRVLACSACRCHLVRYCDAACQLAAWEGQEAECNAEKARREARTRVRIVDSEGEASAA